MTQTSSVEVVRADRGPYVTPEHGFDWQVLELPVKAVATDHLGIISATFGVER
ncbi:MAG: hypothetical protein HYZ07_00070 [Candidatus Harrisonbacteria bacterium]|nr:hypothetical protein [Candidatus Harrisonbacteria bacterium]